MISLRLKVSTYVLLCGFVVGFFTAFLFLPGNPVSTEKREPVKAKQLNREVSLIEKGYQNQINVLKDQYTGLQAQLSSTQKLLDQAKQLIRQKEAKINKIILTSNNYQKDLLPTESSVALFDGVDSPCDSLKIEITGYIDENHRKDSLYETQLAQLDSVVGIKDTIIHANEGLYNSLREVYNTAITDQQVLQDENRLLKKREKRRRLKAKLTTIGVAILSAFSLSYILHH